MHVIPQKPKLQVFVLFLLLFHKFQRIINYHYPAVNSIFYNLEILIALSNNKYLQ